MVSPFGPCCCGDNCPCCENPPNELTVDLGSTGAWVNNDCNQCSTIGGEYTVTKFTPFGENECVWIYCDLNLCVDSSDCDDDWNFIIYLKLTPVTGFAVCRFDLIVQVYKQAKQYVGKDDDACDPSKPDLDPCLQGFRSSRSYFSAVDFDDCSDIFPHTLNFINKEVGSACSGTENSTVSVTV